MHLKKQRSTVTTREHQYIVLTLIEYIVLAALALAIKTFFDSLYTNSLASCLMFSPIPFRMLGTYAERVYKEGKKSYREHFQCIMATPLLFLYTVIGAAVIALPMSVLMRMIPEIVIQSALFGFLVVAFIVYIVSRKRYLKIDKQHSTEGGGLCEPTGRESL
ncbi:MAG: hypothetical protein MJ124_09700 [Lachnospiraceae bacterium]|nr:hypothetical protein [Lachnospiraceae bacterium]